MLARPSLSARALASVLERSVDCVNFVDLDGRLLWMNPPGQRAMEIDDAATVVGAGWASLWPSESQGAIAGLLQAARSGTPARLTAFCATAKGSPRWWDVGVSLVRDEADEPAGFLAVSRYVTEAERARDLLLDRGATDALALGELAVNSTKHGALGHGEEVEAAAEPEPLRFSWKGRSRRPVAARHRDGGQGLILIDRILRARRGSFRLDWRECGLDAESRL